MSADSLQRSSDREAWQEEHFPTIAAEAGERPAAARWSLHDAPPTASLCGFRRQGWSFFPRGQEGSASILLIETINGSAGEPFHRGARSFSPGEEARQDAFLHRAAIQKEARSGSNPILDTAPALAPVLEICAPPLDHGVPSRETEESGGQKGLIQLRRNREPKGKAGGNVRIRGNDQGRYRITPGKR